jgi:transposase
VSYATVLLRQSYAQIRSFLHDVCGLEISDGEIAAMLTGEALALTPARERIAERIRAAPGAHYDETPWPVADPHAGNFGWVKIATDGPERIVVLGRSRGKGVAEELRGAPSTQVAISDDYAVYDHLEQAHQLCWAHPHRKLRDLASSTTLRPRAHVASRRAYDAFAAIYARVRHVLAATPTTTQRQTAEQQVRALLTAFSRVHRNDPRPLRTLKTTLAGNIEKYLTCLRVPAMPADNNAAERALRSLVLKRKNSFGSKTERGAHTLATLWSVLTTIAARKPPNFFVAYAAARA